MHWCMGKGKYAAEEDGVFRIYILGDCGGRLGAVFLYLWMI